MIIKDFAVKESLGHPVSREGKPIEVEADLQPGQEVLVQGLFGALQMTVKRDSYRVLYAESGQLMVTLAFGEDDRHCWCSTGLINLNGLKKLQID